MFASYISHKSEITYYKTCSILMFPADIDKNIWKLFLYSHKFILTDVSGLQNLFP